MRNLLEKLNNLFEMSFERSKAIEKIRGKSFTYLEHVIKLLLWGNYSTDWLNEIYNYAREMNIIRVKGSNKRLSKKIINDYLIKEYIGNEEEFELFLNSVVDSLVNKDNYIYPSVLRQKSISELYDIFKKFNDELITMISSELSYINVKNLITKYFYG